MIIAVKHTEILSPSPPIKVNLSYGDCLEVMREYY